MLGKHLTEWPVPPHFYSDSSVIEAFTLRCGSTLYQCLYRSKADAPTGWLKEGEDTNKFSLTLNLQKCRKDSERMPGTAAHQQIGESRRAGRHDSRVCVSHLTALRKQKGRERGKEEAGAETESLRMCFSDIFQLGLTSQSFHYFPVASNLHPSVD